MYGICLYWNSGVFQTDKNITVGTVFRPPGTYLDKFHRRMQEIIIKIQKENKKCYIMGDYNINLMNYDVHAPTAEFTDMMYAISFVPLINRPTRITESSATLIDNIFNNYFDGLTKGIQCILVTDINDHFPVVYINDESKKQEKEVIVMERIHSSENKNLFYKALSNMEWNSIYVNNDTQGAFTEFHNKLTTEYNRYFQKNEYISNIMTKSPGYLRVYEGPYEQKINCTEKVLGLKLHIMNRHKMYRNNL